MRKMLLSKHAGFTGITHWLIAMMLLMLMRFLPFPFIREYIRSISSSRLMVLVSMLVVGGASLLPDLDSSPLEQGGSTAIYELGPLGNLLSLGCITISGVVWSVMHTGNDETPPSQHRMLFHAPVMAALIAIWAGAAYSGTDGSATLRSMGSHATFSMWSMWFLACVCTYLGSCMLLYRVTNLFGSSNAVPTASSLVAVITGLYMWGWMGMSSARLLGYSISLGYLFHILADVISKGSAPLFFPIPTPVKTRKGLGFRLWWKPYPFNGRFHITTGGAVNIIMNFAIGMLDVFLAWYIFIKGVA